MINTNHVIFLKELSRLQKLHFLLKKYMDGYFWLSLEEHFFAGFFPGLFFSAKEKILSEKNPAETQSMKIQVKSGKIPVCKNVGKIMQNLGKRRLTPKSAKLTVSQYSKFNHNKQGKSRFNRHGGQTGSGYIDHLDNEKIWYRTAWMLDFTYSTFRKLEIFWQVGCRTCDTGSYKWLFRRL